MIYCFDNKIYWNINENKLSFDTDNDWFKRKEIKFNCKDFNNLDKILTNLSLIGLQSFFFYFNKFDVLFLPNNIDSELTFKNRWNRKILNSTDEANFDYIFDRNDILFIGEV